jgi:hypothetical protein
VTWLKIDDKINTHAKWVALDVLERALWFDASVWSAAHNADGVIPEHMLRLISFSAKVPDAELDRCVASLVAHGWWRRRRKAEGGGWEIVNWLDYQPSKQQVQDRAAAAAIKDERKALHDWLHKTAVGKKVKARIDARDGLWCRYCGTETIITPGDRRGPHRRTYDLVDPCSTWDRTAKAVPAAEVDRIADMWRVACGWCNAIKGSRTPDEAGLEELPALRPCGNLPRSTANGSRAVREVGTDLVGSGLDGPARDGSGLDGKPSGRSSPPRTVPRLMQSAGGVVRVRPEDPAHPDHHHTEGVM